MSSAGGSPGGEELEGIVRARASALDWEGAATAALRGLGPQVLRYLRSLLRDEGAASEAFSHFAWRGLEGFRWESSLRTWAFSLAHHAASDVLDDAWRRRGRPLESAEAASRLADEVRAKTGLRVERQRRALDELREALSVEDRSLLALRVDQWLSWAEIAAILSLETRPVVPAALAKRFERLKERLAKLARERGLVDESSELSFERGRLSRADPRGRTAGCRARDGTTRDRAPGRADDSDLSGRSPSGGWLSRRWERALTASPPRTPRAPSS